MLRLSRSTVKNEYCSQETDKAKKKKSYASSAPTSHTAKVTATECDQGIVKMGKALILYAKIFLERERPHLYLLLQYTYNCSILLLIITVNLLL